MKIAQCMSHDVKLATPTDTIKSAAEMMADADTGAIPVHDGDRLVGMITDRDIAIRAVAKGLGPDAKVADAMTTEVRYCFEDQDVEDVLRNLGDQQLRRLPVLDRNKRLVGIVSMSDLAGHCSSDVAIHALAEVSRHSGLHNQARAHSA